MAWGKVSSGRWRVRTWHWDMVHADWQLLATGYRLPTVTRLRSWEEQVWQEADQAASCPRLQPPQSTSCMTPTSPCILVAVPRPRVSAGQDKHCSLQREQLLQHWSLQTSDLQRPGQDGMQGCSLGPWRMKMRELWRALAWMSISPVLTELLVKDC